MGPINKLGRWLRRVMSKRGDGRTKDRTKNKTIDKEDPRRSKTVRREKESRF